MNARPFNHRGILAIEPKAFGMMFGFREEPAVENRDGVALVSVRGPLLHHSDGWWDCYDGIEQRVAEALATSPKAVVLCIDSPGGLVNGCFELAASLRATAARAGVPLIAYIDGQATSAAYALACAAERIVAPPTAMVGSIGVIDALVDGTGLDAAMGMKFRIVASGARKADGNPHVPTSDEAAAAAQSRVDYLAQHFAGWVGEARSMDAGAVLALEANTFPAGVALGLGLVDELGNLDSLIASIASGQTSAAAAPQKGATPMASNYEEGLAKLRKAAEGDDEEAKLARKMLAAMDDEDGGDEDEDTGGEGRAEGDDPPADDDEDKGGDAKASAALAAKLTALSAKVAGLEASREAEDRKVLRASRPDIADEVFDALASTPLAQVKRIVGAMPKPTVPKPAAAAAVAPTLGQGQGANEVSRLSPQAKAELDARMGLSTIKPGVIEQGNKLVLGAPVPVTEKGA